MMTAIARWSGQDRFLGAAGSGHGIVVDAGEEKLGSSPLELVLIGLCGCTASDVASILRKKCQPFTSLEVTATAERAGKPPRVFTDIKLVYRVGGAVSHKAVEDAVRLSETTYCSVSQMLAKTARITTEIELLG